LLSASISIDELSSIFNALNRVIANGYVARAIIKSRTRDKMPTLRRTSQAGQVPDAAGRQSRHIRTNMLTDFAPQQMLLLFGLTLITKYEISKNRRRKKQSSA
jgi:hypothetical protein